MFSVQNNNSSSKFQPNIAFLHLTQRFRLSLASHKAEHVLCMLLASYKETSLHSTRHYSPAPLQITSSSSLRWRENRTAQQHFTPMSLQRQIRNTKWTAILSFIFIAWANVWDKPFANKVSDCSFNMWIWTHRSSEGFNGSTSYTHIWT